eukprot:2208592-Prymnesium_polylepis.1
MGFTRTRVVMRARGAEGTLPRQPVRAARRSGGRAVSASCVQGARDLGAVGAAGAGCGVGGATRGAGVAAGGRHVRHLDDRRPLQAGGAVQPGCGDQEGSGGAGRSRATLARAAAVQLRSRAAVPQRGAGASGERAGEKQLEHTGRSISRRISRSLLILLILLILRFSGSTAFCVGTCISRMLILAAGYPVQAPRSRRPSRDGRLSRLSPGEPQSGPAAAYSPDCAPARHARLYAAPTP